MPPQHVLGIPAVDGGRRRPACFASAYAYIDKGKTWFVTAFSTTHDSLIPCEGPSYNYSGSRHEEIVGLVEVTLATTPSRLLLWQTKEGRGDRPQKSGAHDHIHGSQDGIQKDREPLLAVRVASM